MPDEKQAETPKGPQPRVEPSGGGFRAVITQDGAAVWRCHHVHFTDHSAKACAARQIERMAA